MPEGPPIFSTKYTASAAAARERHSLFGSVTSSVTPTATPSVQPTKLYPPSIDPLPPNLMDMPLIEDIPKEIPLGPQEVEVE